MDREKTRSFDCATLFWIDYLHGYLARRGDERRIRSRGNREGSDDIINNRGRRFSEGERRKQLGPYKG